jgi:hypothetical protein
MTNVPAEHAAIGPRRVLAHDPAHHLMWDRPIGRATYRFVHTWGSGWPDVVSATRIDHATGNWETTHRLSSPQPRPSA